MHCDKEPLERLMNAVSRYFKVDTIQIPVGCIYRNQTPIKTCISQDADVVVYNIYRFSKDTNYTAGYRRECIGRLLKSLFNVRDAALVADFTANAALYFTKVIFINERISKQLGIKTKSVTPYSWSFKYNPGDQLIYYHNHRYIRKGVVVQVYPYGIIVNVCESASFDQDFDAAFLINTGILSVPTRITWFNQFAQHEFDGMPVADRIDYSRFIKKHITEPFVVNAEVSEVYEFQDILNV
jgi:hypothetical protein